MLKIAEDWIQTGMSEVITLPTVPQPLIFAPRFVCIIFWLDFFLQKLYRKRCFQEVYFHR